MKPVLLCLTQALEALHTKTGAIPLRKHRVKNEVQRQNKKKPSTFSFCEVRVILKC